MDKNKKMIIGILTAAIVLVVAFIVYITCFDSHIEFSSKFKNGITVEYGKKFEEPKIKAYVRGRLINRKGKEIKCTIDSNVDATKTGSYEIKVTAQYGKKTATQTIKVEVRDKKAPEIALNGDAEMTVEAGSEFSDPGYTATDKKEGGAALIAAAKESKTPERTMIGEYKGFKLYSRFDAFFNLYYIHMQGRCEHTIEMSSDPAGMITRLNNCMAGFEKRLSDVQDALDETRIELETAEKEVTKKFDKEDILSEKLKRLSFLNAQLDADRKETPQNAPQNKQAQRNDTKEKYINI